MRVSLLSIATASFAALVALGVACSSSDDDDNILIPPVDAGLDADTGADTGPEEDAADTGPDAAPDDALCKDEADCNACCEDNHTALSKAALEAVNTTCGCLSPALDDPSCLGACGTTCKTLTAPTGEDNECATCLTAQANETVVADCTAKITACGDDCKKLNDCVNTCPR